MLINSDRLPTNIARVASRLELAGKFAASDTFNCASYLFEATLKLNVIVLYACLKPYDPLHAYRIGRRLFDASNLGPWMHNLRTLTNTVRAGYLPPETYELYRWFTKERVKSGDEWAIEAFESANAVLSDIQSTVNPARNAKPCTIINLIKCLVDIRNGTRGHGAPGEDRFEQINDDYMKAVVSLVERCPAFDWKWFYVYTRPDGNVRGAFLKGSTPKALSSEDVSNLRGLEEGVHFVPPNSHQPYSCGLFVKSTRECQQFFLPNSKMEKDGPTGEYHVEFLDYSDDSKHLYPVSEFRRKAPKYSKSVTAANDDLDVDEATDTFTNLPAPREDYVERKSHETALRARLDDTNHALIVLHGPGGIGKTYLALHTARSMADKFAFIFWFSARDWDLGDSRTAEVSPDVSRLEHVRKMLERHLTSVDMKGKLTLSRFRQILVDPSIITKDKNKGILFIFDNFETMTDLEDAYEFLDKEAHIPNKILITTREKGSKTPGTPVEVKGMDRTEARELIESAARRLCVPGIIKRKDIDSIYERTGGHAYVMRLIVGEIASEPSVLSKGIGNYLPNKIEDIAEDIFRRQFNKLVGRPGWWVFLVVANAGAVISRLALDLILGAKGIDVEIGVKECDQLALIKTEELSDGSPCYSVHELARIFGKKKLQANETEDGLLISECIRQINRFNDVSKEKKSRRTQEHLVERFILTCFENAEDAKEQGKRSRVVELNEILERLAKIWPPAWGNLAEFRRRYGFAKTEILRAYQCAVEENPDNRDILTQRAEYACEIGNGHLEILSRIRAAQCEPIETKQVCQVVGKVKRFVEQKSNKVNQNQRRAFLNEIKGMLEDLEQQGKLNAQACAYISWLMLEDDDKQAAKNYAKKGLKYNNESSPCRRILDKLELQPTNSKVSKKKQTKTAKTKARKQRKS